MSDDMKSFSFNLELSNEDYIELCKLAGLRGITVDCMLENFVKDLVFSNESNGSDERHAAREWFDRCWIGRLSEDTFLRYMIDSNWITDFVDRYNHMRECEEELEKLTDMDLEPEKVKALQEEAEYQRQTLKKYYCDYIKETYEHLSNEDGMVMKWLNELYKVAADTVMKWWSEVESHRVK